MAAKSSNNNLHKAKDSKKDEFYTQLSDIENELKHYKDHFKDKIVYCNCDDPRVSNFFQYISFNFEAAPLGLNLYAFAHLGNLTPSPNSFLTFLYSTETTRPSVGYDKRLLS